MSDNNVVEALARGNENVVEDVPEVENKSVMPPKKEEEIPTITNPEPVADTPKVNKKLSAMSKNTKEKQKNRKLSKPTVSRTPSKGFSLNINPMYLLGLIGVIIAGASLWYQRKSFLKDSEDKDDEPVQSSGGETEEKKSPVKKSPKKQQHFDPWAWKREHQQIGVFPGNYDFE